MLEQVLGPPWASLETMVLGGRMGGSRQAAGPLGAWKPQATEEPQKDPN